MMNATDSSSRTSKRAVPSRVDDLLEDVGDIPLESSASRRNKRSVSKNYDTEAPPDITPCSSAEGSAAAASDSSTVNDELEGDVRGLTPRGRNTKSGLNGDATRSSEMSNRNSFGKDVCFPLDEDGFPIVPFCCAAEDIAHATNDEAGPSNRVAPRVYANRIQRSGPSERDLSREPRLSDQARGEATAENRKPTCAMVSTSSGLQMDAATMSAVMNDEGVSQELASAMNSQELLEAWEQQHRYDEAKRVNDNVSPDFSFLEHSQPGVVSVRPPQRVVTPPPANRLSRTRPINDAETAAETAAAVAESHAPPKKRRRCLFIWVIVVALIAAGSVAGLIIALQGKSSGGGGNNASTTTSTPKELHAIVVIQPDKFPQHISWILREGAKDEFGTVLNRVSAGRHAPTKTTIAVPVTEGSTYTFRIADLGQDGICCRAGRGYFYVLRSDNGRRLVAGNGDFGKAVQYSFVV